MADAARVDEYRRIASQFKPNNGDLLACLHEFQHHYGYIPTDAVPVIARQFQVQSAHVFGTLSFYSEFRTTEPPDTLINWCSGPACRMKGGEDIRRVMEAVLGVGMEENTPDNRTGLHLAQCEGSCQYAPLVWLRQRGAHPHQPDGVLVAERGEVTGNLTVADAVRLARRLKDGEGGA